MVRSCLSLMACRIWGSSCAQNDIKWAAGGMGSERCATRRAKLQEPAVGRVWGLGHRPAMDAWWRCARSLGLTEGSGHVVSHLEAGLGHAHAELAPVHHAVQHRLHAVVDDDGDAP